MRKAVTVMGQSQWRWDTSKFEQIKKPHVETKSEGGDWVVTVMDSDLSWGYCIPFSDDAKQHILWSATIRINSASGEVAPGLCFRENDKGLLFLVNKYNNTAELRLVEVDNRTTRAATYSFPDKEYPYDLILEYNSLTAKCAGAINENKIFEIQLPFNGIPSFNRFEALEIITTITENETEGTVAYGPLKLLAE